LIKVPNPGAVTKKKENIGSQIGHNKKHFKKYVYMTKHGAIQNNWNSDGL